MNIGVKMTGVADLKASVASLRGIMEKNIGEAITKSAEAIKAEAQRRIPSRTGKTRKKIRIRYRKKRMGATVRVNGVVARWIEYGTGPHSMRSKNGKALHMEIGGASVFRAGANHPGTPASPFMRPAFEQERGATIERINQALHRTAAEAGR